MTTFTSARERRLWMAAGVVLVAIYASAVFAESLVRAIGASGYPGIVFAAGFVLAIATVAGIAVGRRPRAEAWVAAGVATAYLMVPVRAGVSAVERTHLFEYGLLAVLLHEALDERRRNGARVRVPALAAIAAAALFPWLDEAVQALMPSRVYDLRDVLVNALAAVVAVGALALVRAARTRAAGA